MNTVIDRVNEQSKLKVMQYGIYWCNLPENDQHIQAGRRPVLVISNNACNKFSPVITVVPITTRVKRNMPTHLMFNKELANIYGLSEPSIVMAECILSINKDSLISDIGYISDIKVQDAIEEKILTQISRRF